jgi:lincosamide and streptogramin A transport system ATP-binding/permease protein
LSGQRKAGIHMAEINVNNLTFSYDTSYDNIFENTSFQIDTDWKLGFIGRNGRGKTTFLNLLLGKYEYSGIITSSVSFDYFPFHIENKERNTLDIIKDIIAPYLMWEEKMQHYEKLFETGIQEEENSNAMEEYSEILNLYIAHDGYEIDDMIQKEIGMLEVTRDVLYRPFSTLSNGEQTKLLLAGLFLKKNNFLLIDEPTNHLDLEARDVLKEYLSSKKGFLLVSHDRDFIDHVVDHILSINRHTIEVIKGNFSVWQENRNRKNQFELDENAKLEKSIIHLETAIKKTAGWSDKVEATKIGQGGSVDRGYIGAQSAKLMKRVKAIEHRKNKELEEKSRLLKDIETSEPLKMNLLDMKKNRVLDVNQLTFGYENESKKRILFQDLTFSINVGDRISIRGKNGSGKSSIIKLILDRYQDLKNNTLNSLNPAYKGSIKLTNEIVISYVPQDTSFLKGSLKEFIEKNSLKESIFKMLLRKLDFPRVQFDKKMEEYSEGQKKKVLLASSLITPAHLFIWDEPLNYIDVLSRIQIEELILQYQPTMLFVEHDIVFTNKIATRIIELT